MGERFSTKDPFYEKVPEKDPRLLKPNEKVEYKDKRRKPPLYISEQQRVLWKKIMKRAWYHDRNFCGCMPIDLGCGMISFVSIFPIIGSIIAYKMHYKLIKMCNQAGVPAKLQAQMVGNIGLDFMMTLVPLLGVLLSWIQSSSTRNAALFDTWLRKQSNEVARRQTAEKQRAGVQAPQRGEVRPQGRQTSPFQQQGGQIHPGRQASPAGQGRQMSPGAQASVSSASQAHTRQTSPNHAPNISRNSPQAGPQTVPAAATPRNTPRAAPHASPRAAPQSSPASHNHSPRRKPVPSQAPLSQAPRAQPPPVPSHYSPYRTAQSAPPVPPKVPVAPMPPQAAMYRQEARPYRTDQQRAGQFPPSGHRPPPGYYPSPPSTGQYTRSGQHTPPSEYVPSGYNAQLSGYHSQDQANMSRSPYQYGQFPPQPTPYRVAQFRPPPAGQYPFT